MHDLMERSGRTTRMIEHAKKEAEAGRSVYLVFAHAGQSRYWRPRVEPFGIKAETVLSVGRFDWESMRTRGAHRNCLFLVDHFAVHQQLGNQSHLYQALHRWDDATAVNATAVDKIKHALATDQPIETVLDAYYYARRIMHDAHEQQLIDRRPIVNAVLDRAQQLLDDHIAINKCAVPTTPWYGPLRPHVLYVQAQQQLIDKLSEMP